MSYVLATTGTKVKWYKFKVDRNTREGDFELVDELDLMSVPMFGDKETAKSAAVALGLKTLRYVKL